MDRGPHGTAAKAAAFRTTSTFSSWETQVVKSSMMSPHRRRVDFDAP